MLTTVFIFDEENKASRYGIGTYIKQLTKSLSMLPNLKIYWVAYSNSNVEEFKETKISLNFFKLEIPTPVMPLKEASYIISIEFLLRPYFEQASKSVLQFNSYKDLALINVLREKYNFPMLGVVHFDVWKDLFKSNRLLYERKKEVLVYKEILDTEKEFYKILDCVICLNAYMRSFIHNAYAIELSKLKVIPNGIEINQPNMELEDKVAFKLKMGFAKTDKIILFVGRVDELKGVGVLLKAFSTACERDANVRLVLIGDGNISEILTNNVQTVYSKISFTGFLSSQQLNNWYNIVDVAVFSSFSDQCPYTVLETVRAKVPLILSNIDGMNELFDDSACYLITPKTNDDGTLYFDNKELAELIIEVLENKEKARAFSENAYKMLVNNYDAQIMANKMNEIYINLSR